MEVPEKGIQAVDGVVRSVLEEASKRVSVNATLL